MNILLTGGAGYIGSHVAAVLAGAGHHVTIYDNLRNSTVSVIDCLETLIGKRPNFVRGDILDTKLLAKTARSRNIDAIIHLAGLKSLEESVASPLAYYHINVQGTLSLLRAMEVSNVSKLVFSSSAAVYGKPDYLPMDEGHPLRATNPYGRTKLHIEGMLFDLARSNDHWSVACLRYFNPAGAHESGLIGESPLGMPTNLMPYIAQVAMGKLPYVKVFGKNYKTPDGTGIRDYIHVMDVAGGHLAALDFLRMESGWHAFNLGTGRGYSVLEMIRAFEAASGESINYQFRSRRACDIAVCYADPGKADRLLRWRAKRSLEEMCASAWRYQQWLKTQGAADAIAFGLNVEYR